MLRGQRAPRPELPPSHWGLTEKPGGLAYEGLDLHGLLAKWGSPLHVVQGARLASNIHAFLCPRRPSGAQCEVFYSYKTNPIPGVLTRMHALGVGAEVISHYELWLAFRLGVPPESIIYNGPAKSDVSMEEAISRGILLINANHREEISRLARAATKVQKRPTVGLRVSSMGGWSGQFGIPIDGGEALAAYEEALAQKSLDVRALHAHRGMPLRSQSEVAQFAGSILDFLSTLEEKLKLTVEMVDLGGSFAIPTVAHLSEVDKRLNRTFQRPLSPPNPDDTLSLSSYVSLLLEMVEDYCQKRGRPVPRIFLEPGRAMTGNTQFLLSSVIDTKAASPGLTFAIMDAGINLAESAKNEYHQLLPVNRHGEPKSRTYAWAGPICSPGDVLYSAWELPNLSPGDSVAIMDAGAYFVPFATSFSFPQPAIIWVQDGKDTLLRRAETFEDLVAFDR
jgi:diaminopimelate decarboxylase